MGTLRGYDQYMNIVLENTHDESPCRGGSSSELGTVVVRGNNILQFELVK